MVDYGQIDDSWEKKRQQIIIQAAGRVERIYNKAAERMSGYFNQIKPTTEVQKVWTKNPKISKKIDKILVDFNKELREEIQGSFKNGWHLANDKHDAIAADYLKGIAIGSELKKGMFDRNMKAMEAFLNEGVYGENLSKRVWNLSKHYKKQLKFFAASGIGSGKDSRKIAADLKKYLKYPDKRFRRIRDPETGKLKTSAPASEFHPGTGVYRSSYKNAWRYIASETNRAYRTADYNRIQQEPFVTGIKIKLSAAHPRYDICDEQVGTYPKGYKFTGFHPWCICYQTTIMLGKRDFAKYLKTRTVPGEKYINSIPDNARRYLNNNLSKLKGRKNLPMFMKENFNTSGSAVGVKKNVFPKSNEMEKTINQVSSPEIRELTEDEFEAMRKYKSSYYGLLNRNLREGTKLHEVVEPVYHGLKSGIRHSPKYEGRVYRGMSFENKIDFDDFRNKMQQGHYTHDKAFISTSKDDDLAFGFAEDKYKVFIRINAKGKNGVDTNKVMKLKGIEAKEQEVIFNSGSSFKIEEITEEMSKTTGEIISLTIKLTEL